MEWIILFAVIALIAYRLLNKPSKAEKIVQNESPQKLSLESDKSNTKARITDHTLSISSINFYGRYLTSENEMYIVGCQDSDYRGGRRGGFRESGMGRIILLKENSLQWAKDFERPHDARVSNDGFVAVNDWLFGEGLKGKFFVLDPSGEIITKDRFSANLHTLGITADSKLAWTTTLVSNNSDSTQLIFYDV